MAEKRKPEFMFQAYKKEQEGGKPEHLSTFEIYPARLWMGVPRVTRCYGPHTPLPGLFRLRVDQRWFEFHKDYMFLTFHEVWRIAGTLASEVLNWPVSWVGEPTERLNQGDRVRVMWRQGYMQTFVLESQLDERGIEWVSVQGIEGQLPGNAAFPVKNMARGEVDSFFRALPKLKPGLCLWYWPETPSGESGWEVIPEALAGVRGLPPQTSTVLALQMGGMSLYEAEEYYKKELAA